MAKPKKRKVYTRKNVKPSGEGFRGQARNKSSKLQKLKDQAKTYTRESGKAKATSSPYDVTNQFNKYKKDRLKVKVKPKGKAPKPKPKAKAAQNPWQKKKAPKVNKFKKVKPKSWLQKNQERGAQRASDLADKAAKNKAIKDFNKAKPAPKGQAPKLTKKQLNAAKGTRAIQKGLRIGKNVGKLGKAGSFIKHGIVGAAADWGTDQVTDRIGRQITGNSKMSLKDFRAKRAAWEKENVTWWGGVKKGAPKNFEARDTESTSSSTGKTKTSDSNKSSKGTSKKKFTARDRMRAKNVEIHGEEAISKLEKSHKDWKAARKAGTLKTKRKKKTRPDTWRDVE